MSSCLSANLGLHLHEADYSLLQERFQAAYEPWERHTAIHGYGPVYGPVYGSVYGSVSDCKPVWRPPAEVDYQALSEAVDVVFGPNIEGEERDGSHS